MDVHHCLACTGFSLPPAPPEYQPGATAYPFSDADLEAGEEIPAGLVKPLTFYQSVYGFLGNFLYR